MILTVIRSRNRRGRRRPESHPRLERLGPARERRSSTACGHGPTGNVHHILQRAAACLDDPARCLVADVAGDEGPFDSEIETMRKDQRQREPAEPSPAHRWTDRVADVPTANAQRVGQPMTDLHEPDEVGAVDEPERRSRDPAVRQIAPLRPRVELPHKGREVRVAPKRTQLLVSPLRQRTLASHRERTAQRRCTVRPGRPSTKYRRHAVAAGRGLQGSRSHWTAATLACRRGASHHPSVR